MKLEVEYDQLKHQLSPMHQKMSSSPGRSENSIFILINILFYICEYRAINISTRFFRQ